MLWIRVNRHFSKIFSYPIYIFASKAPTHFVNGSCPLKRKEGTSWNKEGIDRKLWVPKPTWRKIPAREWAWPFRNWTEFLKMPKEKNRERKNILCKRKKIPTGHVSKKRQIVLSRNPKKEGKWRDSGLWDRCWEDQEARRKVSLTSEAKPWACWP